MIRRLTVWTAEHGDVQASLALLSDDWDPLREITRGIGPFDDLPGVVQLLTEELNEWVNTYGIQERLPLG